LNLINKHVQHRSLDERKIGNIAKTGAAQPPMVELQKLFTWKNKRNNIFAIEQWKFFWLMMEKFFSFEFDTYLMADSPILADTNSLVFSSEILDVNITQYSYIYSFFMANYIRPRLFHQALEALHKFKLEKSILSPNLRCIHSTGPRYTYSST
jgi:hypothetical protein